MFTVCLCMLSVDPLLPLSSLPLPPLLPSPSPLPPFPLPPFPLLTQSCDCELSGSFSDYQHPHVPLQHPEATEVGEIRGKCVDQTDHHCGGEHRRYEQRIVAGGEGGLSEKCSQTSQLHTHCLWALGRHSVCVCYTALPL